MNRLATCALVLLLSAPAVFAGELSIDLNSNDSRVDLAPRRNPRSAQLAITSRDGSTVLMLAKDVVAIQLSDAEMAKMEADTEKDTNFFEELILAGVRNFAGKSMEYPVAKLKVDYRGGALQFRNEKSEPIFTEFKVNNVDVMRNFSSADATRFVNAVRTAQSRRN
ncbi:MAG TPA: hypothetical protein VF787_27265 [Thermoanaerobaculia bacterium]